MVGSKFYLNSIFFSDVLDQYDLIKMLKKIYSIIDCFEEPNIVYNTNDTEFYECMSQISQITDSKLKTFLLIQLRKLYKEVNNEKDSVELCLNDVEGCLISISKNFQWNSRLYRKGSCQTDNIFDVASTIDQYKKRNFQRLIPNIISQLEINYRIGKIKDLYPTVNSIKFHDEFNQDYINASTNPNVKKKWDDFLKMLFLGEKTLDCYDYHSESETVRRSVNLSEERKVKFNKQEKIIYNHLKLDQNWSSYIEINGDTIYFGKLTSHLTTKKY